MAEQQTSPPWFRFYSEALNDRKVKYVCRATGQPKVIVVGAWSMLMSLANDSPIRGALLLTEEKPFTIQDLADEMEIDEQNAKALIAGFIEMHMVSYEGGVYYLTNWDRRQFASDSSTERVRRYRDRKKDGIENTSGGVTTPLQDGHSNEHETLQERDGNAPDQSRSESETESESEQSSGAAAPSPDGDRPSPNAEIPKGEPEQPSTFQDWSELLQVSGNRPAVLVRMFEALYPGRDPPDFGYMGKVARQLGGAGRMAELLWQNSTRPPTGDVLAYCLAVGKRGKDNGNGTEQRVAQPIRLSDDHYTSSAN